MPDGALRVSNVQLAQYEAARQALAECVRIDEAAEIRDKAAALAAYARQRDDKELESWIAEIKCRAVVRIGALSRELDRSQGARTELLPSTRTKSKALTDAGISTSSAHEYEQLAEADAAEPTKAEAYYADCKARGVAPTLGGLRAALKQDKRATREAELAEATEEASRQLGKELYGVLYADPPWRFEPFSRDTGMDRAADNHYPTMTIDLIRKMAVPAADDAVLFLWATVPMLPEALSVMEAWGFTYKSHFVWNKDHAGTGYWNRNRHELLLVGTRGDIPAPAPGQQFCSVIEAPTSAHSRKPMAFAEMIEEMFPKHRHVELFARGPRLGWDTWGNEA
jgi:N6-adenosine-specific RNA methylase IME4